tara:strand:- start:2665 stop:2982 length:318 start_codon:yes stop_codon:yes gene_type:complete
MIYYALALKLCATIIVFYKANLKELYGLDYSPLFWWLTVGWIVEYCFLQSWWILSKAISPWATYILLLGFGSITHMVLMCIHYGFNVKYFLGFLLIISGVLVSKM